MDNLHKNIACKKTHSIEEVEERFIFDAIGQLGKSRDASFCNFDNRLEG